MLYLTNVKHSLFKLDQLQEAKKMNLGVVIFHLLLLSFVLAIPISLQVIQVFSTIQDDGKEIAQKIPDFTIEKGVLVTKDGAEGFIYQTDSIIFTFDPEGKRTADDISKDMLGNFLSIGLLQKELVVTLPATENINSLFGSNQLTIPYTSTQLHDLTGENLRDRILENEMPWWLAPLTFLIAIYPAFLSLIITIAVATLFANLFSRMRGRYDGFLNNFKIIVFCSTLPVIITTLINLLNPSFIGDTFILIASVFIFLFSLNNHSDKKKII